MNRCYDLHTHTYYSDGMLSPSDLVSRASEAGIEVLALTDHDTTVGLAEAIVAAGQVCIDLVPGVEISTTWNGKTIHIVGLQIDPENEVLNEGLASLLDIRNERAVIMSEKLNRRGFSDVDGAVQEMVKGPVISRTHYARAMVEAGYARDIPQAFKKYLVGGKAGYASTHWVDLEEAVNWIRQAGGHAVIAHPGRYKMSSGKLRSLFAEFAAVGGEAVEIISGSQHPDQTDRLARFAAEHGLMASVGSDYHGPEQSWINLGRLPKLPKNCEPLWQLWC